MKSWIPQYDRRRRIEPGRAPRPPPSPGRGRRRRGAAAASAPVQPMPVDQRREAAGVRVPEVGVAAERGALGGAHAGEPRRPVLRVGQDRRGARGRLGEAAELPEELRPEVQPRGQPRRAGLREARAARRRTRRRARPARDARSRAPAAPARRPRRPAPPLAPWAVTAIAPTPCRACIVRAASRMKRPEPPRCRRADRAGRAAAGSAWSGRRSRRSVGAVDQRRLGVGLADVEDEDSWRAAPSCPYPMPAGSQGATMGRPRCPAIKAGAALTSPPHAGARYLEDASSWGGADACSTRRPATAWRTSGTTARRRGHERAGAAALPLEPARRRQADHQLRRRQHLGQGDGDGPADRRDGRGALGQGLGRRRRHDQARRLRHALHGEARGAEGPLPRRRARGRDGGLPAPLHLQPQPARRLDRHAAARLRAARRMSTTCTPTRSSPSPPRRTRRR